MMLAAVMVHAHVNRTRVPEQVRSLLRGHRSLGLGDGLERLRGERGTTRRDLARGGTTRRVFVLAARRRAGVAGPPEREPGSQRRVVGRAGGCRRDSTGRSRRRQRVGGCPRFGGQRAGELSGHGTCTAHTARRGSECPATKLVLLDGLHPAGVTPLLGVAEVALDVAVCG
jgi:hypothetical protein